MFTSSELKVITEQNSLLSLYNTAVTVHLPERRKRRSETLTLCAATKVTRNPSIPQIQRLLTDKLYHQGTARRGLYTLHMHECCLVHEGYT